MTVGHQPSESLDCGLDYPRYWRGYRTAAIAQRHAIQGKQATIDRLTYRRALS